MGNLKGESKKIYFGWFIVGTCFLIFLTVYSAAYNLAGIFIAPMAKDLNVSTTASTTVLTILFTGAMIGTPIFGNILDKFNLRKVAISMLIVTAVTFFVAGASDSIMVHYIVAAIRGIALSGVLTIPISILMTNWFGKKLKGRAFSFVVIGSGIGTMALNPITGYIIDTLSWRTAYYGYGIMTLTLILPVALTFIRRPEDIGLQRIGDIIEDEGEAAVDRNVGLTQKFAVRTAMFWATMMIFVLVCAMSQNWLVNGYTYLADIGYSATLTGAIFMVTSLGITAGKIFFGLFNDKLGSKYTWLICAVLFMVAYGTIMLSGRDGSMAVIYIGSAVMGFTTGAIVLMMPLSASDLFGQKQFAPIYSYLESGATLASSYLPLGFAAIYDKTGSFSSTWLINIGMAATMIVLIFVGYGLKGRTYKNFEK